MSGCYGNSAEDRYFERQLNKFLDEQDAAERREEMIEQKAKDLMQPGQEYDPWKFSNFMEAFCESSESMQQNVFCSIAAAVVDSKLENEYGNHLALTMIKKMVEDYWLDVAKHNVERDF